MPKNLVIVESPSKAKTISKYLSRNYKVMACVGHVRDLPKSKLGVDVKNNFEPHYITIRGKGGVVKELRKEAKKAKNVYLATDPDREGEAIAWHLQTLLGLEEGKHRISFHEITKDAVKKAIKEPRDIDLDLVDSQQARRIVDRLVGYQISPLLWRKVMKGLSAGRVQSVTTRLIVNREKEIKAFVPKEYWNFSAEFTSDKKSFVSDITKYLGKKIDIDNEKDALEIEKKLKEEAFTLAEVQKKKRKRNAPAVYTTASLQRDAANHLNFTVQKTMRTAQSLYEGIALKGGSVGLITYMRTDSTRVASEAQEQAKTFIEDTYGKNYAKTYVRKNDKGAQDAHEGIRVTNVNLTPESIKSYLKRDEYRLYNLIWSRFVASQMAAAQLETTTFITKSQSFEGRTNGQQMVFDGFLKVYTYGSSKDTLLPDLNEGIDLETKAVTKEQKFTLPPSRYTEATLIKEMEDNGIGRPSTYAPTIYTILSRKYVEKQGKSLVPTELGFITNEIMEEHFRPLVEVDFTANMEEQLDEISQGDYPWKKVLADFYKDFEPLLEKAEDNIKKYNLDELTDQECERCGHPMLIKKTIKGDFLACSNWPECTNTKSILKPIGVDCPECKEGQIVERRTRRLKTFWGCDQFPACRFATWNKPINEFCPKCGKILVEGKGRLSSSILCSNKDCDYRRPKSQQEKAKA